MVPSSTFSSARAGGMLLLIFAAFAALVGRVAYLQTYGRERTIRQAEREHHQSEVWYARRGGIFDAKGQLLACTVQANTLFVDPHFMFEAYQQPEEKKKKKLTLVTMDEDVARLARAIDRTPFELSQLISDHADSHYLVLAENVDEHLAAMIEKMNIPGVGFIPANQRYYPMGSVAAHLLGGTGADGEGLEGLELKFNKVLSGIDGFKRTLKTAQRRPIGVDAEDYVPPQHGQYLVLTIDANIQIIAEQELKATCEKFGAKHGEVVVMDPRTGEILALANYPTFNPQNLNDSSPETRLDRAIVVPYEPGSTFKPFIVGPALSWRLTRPGEVMPIHGPIYHVASYRRTVTDVHGYDALAVWDVLVKSSNIGASMIAERLGNPRLFKAITSFGFGRPTGVELPGEDEGRVNPLNKWTKYSTESVAQGYEVMITPIQLARAFCTYANGGHLVPPHVVKGVLDADGNVIDRVQPVKTEQLPRVIDQSTADEVRRILSDVVIRGTATGARSNTWNIFGKTGTAHITEGAHYSATKFNSSFVAGAPYENPRLVVSTLR